MTRGGQEGGMASQAGRLGRVEAPDGLGCAPPPGPAHAPARAVRARALEVPGRAAGAGGAGA